MKQPQMINQNKTGFRWIWLSVLVVLADQGAKWLVLKTMAMGQVIILLPFLNLTLTFNTGAAFSFLSHAGGWQVIFFIVIGLFVSVVLFVWLINTPLDNRLSSIALALMIGGAIGNVIDRIRFGYVVDFIDAHIGAYHWPIFNVADSAISIGLVLLIVSWFLND